MVILAVFLGLFVNSTAGWLLGLFGTLGVLFAWRAGVVGNAAENWSRTLYGPDEDREGSGYADLMGRRLAAGRRSRASRRHRPS